MDGLTLEQAKERARKFYKTFNRYRPSPVPYMVICNIPEIHIDYGFHVISTDDFNYQYALERKAIVWAIVPSGYGIN